MFPALRTLVHLHRQYAQGAPMLFKKQTNKKNPLSEKWSEKNCFLNVRRARELDVIPQWRLYLERRGGWLFPFAEDNSVNFGKRHNPAVPQQITAPWQSRSHGHMGCASLLPIPFYCVYVWQPSQTRRLCSIQELRQVSHPWMKLGVRGRPCLQPFELPKG